MSLRKLSLVPGIILRVENWPTYFASYSGLLGKRRVNYRLRNGLVFEARAGTNDRSALNDVWIRQVYNPPGFEVRKSDIVVDIGAHIGFFSVKAAREAPNGRVLSFEPAPDNIKLLERNITLNGARNVTAIHKAVAGEVGMRRLFLSRDNTGAHSIVPDGLSTESVEVESTSLEEVTEIVEPHAVDFLKIDCEGGEYEILLSSTDRTLSKVEKIAVEYHNIDGERNGDVLRSSLVTKGYDVATAREGPHVGMLFAKRYRPRREIASREE